VFNTNLSYFRAHFVVENDETSRVKLATEVTKLSTYTYILTTHSHGSARVF